MTTPLKRGDKIHIEFDAELDVIHDSGVTVVMVGANYFDVPNHSVTKIEEPLPTKIGSVIRVTHWMGGPVDYVAMLSKWNKWRFAVDEQVTYPSEDLAKYATEWELIYTPGQ